MSTSSPLLVTLTEGFPYCNMLVLENSTEIIAVLHIIQLNVIKLKISYVFNWYQVIRTQLISAVP